MARVIHHVDPAYVRRDDTEVVAGPALFVERLVSLIGGVIISLLTLRFLLSLFGANRGNGIADFIYNTSHPFVSPFFGLFNYQENFGVSRFEFETLIAIIFYAIATALIMRVIAVFRHDYY